MGCTDIISTVTQRKLSFIYSISTLPDEALAKKVPVATLDGGVSPSSVIHSWSNILSEHSLPSIEELLNEAPCKPLTWKLTVKLILRSKFYIYFEESCTSLPVANCSSESFMTGKCLPHWKVCKGNRKMTRDTNFKIRLLTGCHGLECDASCFTTRKRGLVGDPSCKLCVAECETPKHFLCGCKSLSESRSRLLCDAPEKTHSSFTDPDVFFDFLLGTDWIQDVLAQEFLVNFITEMRSCRNQTPPRR